MYVIEKSKTKICVLITTASHTIFKVCSGHFVSVALF